MDVTMNAPRHRTHGTPHSFAALFEPDTVLPTQFFTARRRQLSGEERLALAVLEDAIDAATIRVDHPDWKRRKLRDDVLDWFRVTDRAWLFSFVNICELFNYDVEAVRAAVLGGRARTDSRSVRVVETRPAKAEGPGAYRKPATSAVSPRWVSQDSPERLAQKRLWAQRQRERERDERAAAQL